MGETSLSTNEAFFLLLGLLMGISSMGGVLWYFLRERNRKISELEEQVKFESQKNSEAMIMASEFFWDSNLTCSSSSEIFRFLSRRKYQRTPPIEEIPIRRPSSRKNASFVERLVSPIR